MFSSDEIVSNWSYLHFLTTRCRFSHPFFQRPFHSGQWTRGRANLSRKRLYERRKRRKDRDPLWALYVRSSSWSRAFRDRIFVLLRIRFAPRVHDEQVYSWKPDTEGRGSCGKRKGPRVTCVGRNPSFFRSANTLTLPPSYQRMPFLFLFY